MENKIIWILFLTAGAGTFMTRISFIHLLKNRDIPPVLSRLLKFVPPAVLSALILPAILVQNGSLNVSVDNGQIPGAIAAAIVAVFSKNTILIIGTGMGILWLHQWIVL